MSEINQTENKLAGVVKVERAVSLKTEIENMLSTDPKFKGLAKYMQSLVFWWTRDIQTACAGDGFIFFNPDFYDNLVPETKKTIVAHEVWHLILKHLKRGENYEPEYYNIAADHVINNMLEDNGFTFEGEDNCCKDPQYKGKSTEQIYHEIYVDKPPSERPKVSPGKNTSPEKIKKLIEQAIGQEKAESGQSNGDITEDDKQDQKDKNENAISKGINPGDIPGYSNISLDAMNLRVVIENASYHEIFKKYLIDPLGGGARSFLRPSRRHQASKTLVLPGRLKRKGNKQRLTHLVYALDVSGSISPKQAQQFHNSVRTIKEMLHPKKLTVLFFDTRIVLEKTFLDTEPYGEIKVQAGGGTDLTDVYKRTAEINPEALVIFTDLCVKIPPKPDWHTIWLVPFTHVYADNNLYGDLYLVPDLGK